MFYQLKKGIPDCVVLRTSKSEVKKRLDVCERINELKQEGSEEIIYPTPWRVTNLPPIN